MFNFLYIFLLTISFFMIFAKNPINSILFLILIFFNISILFFLYNLDILGIIFILLYVGAIAILFLFIVMMINVKNIEKDDNTYFFIGGLFFFIFFVQLIYLFINNFFFIDFFNLKINSNFFSFFFYNKLDELNRVSFFKNFSLIIFVYYPIFLILSCFLILITLFSCIFLSNFKTGFSVRKQYNQLFRNSSLINLYVY